MPENDADRIIRERTLQRQRQEELEKQRAEQQNVARAETLGSKIEADMSVVFKMLAAQDYPFAHEATIITWKNTWLGGRKEIKEHKAAWMIGEFWSTFRGDRVRYQIELFSDGRIRSSGEPITVRESVKNGASLEFLETVLRGIKNLRQKLEDAAGQTGSA
jgi:hypothetical protein